MKLKKSLVDGLQTAFDESFYDAAKPETVRLLHALETNENYASEWMKLDVRTWFNLISALMEKG